MTHSEDNQQNSPLHQAVLEMPGLKSERGNGYFIRFAAVRRIENKNNWVESKKPTFKTLKT